MSNICRKCLGGMSSDRKGHEQICPKCKAQMNSMHNLANVTSSKKAKKYKSVISMIWHTTNNKVFAIDCILNILCKKFLRKIRKNNG